MNGEMHIERFTRGESPSEATQDAQRRQMVEALAEVAGLSAIVKNGMGRARALEGLGWLQAAHIQRGVHARSRGTLQDTAAGSKASDCCCG